MASLLDQFNQQTNKQEGDQQGKAVSDRMAEGQRDPDAVILLVEQITVKEQGRKSFTNIDDLAHDIKTRGQLQPIVVKQVAPFRYQLIAGERRLRAVRDVLKLDMIKASVKRDADDDLKTAFVQLAENAQRENLLPFELASVLDGLKDQFGLTHDQIAKEINKSKSFVTRYLGLLDETRTPVHIRGRIESGELAVTDWFNNRDVILNEGVPAQVEQKTSKKPVKGKTAKKGKPARVARMAISQNDGFALVTILQWVAKRKKLDKIDVDPNQPLTKKEALAIIEAHAQRIVKEL